MANFYWDANGVSLAGGIAVDTPPANAAFIRSENGTGIRPYDPTTSTSQSAQDASIAANQAKLTTKATIDLDSTYTNDADLQANTEDTIGIVDGVVKIYDAETDTVQDLAATIDDVDAMYASITDLNNARAIAKDKTLFEDPNRNFAILSTDGYTYGVYNWSTSLNAYIGSFQASATLTTTINAASVVGAAVVIDNLGDGRYTVVANDGNEISAVGTLANGTVTLANGKAHVTLTANDTLDLTITNAAEVVYPATAAQIVTNAENIIYLDHTLNIPGDFPTAASGQWIGVSVIQANSTDTQATKDAAKKRTSTWSAFDTGAGFIWIMTEGSTEAGFTAHQEVILPHDAANSDVTPENTDVAIASVGIKPSRLPFTAVAQKVAYNITDSGDIVAYVVKHTGTAFTLQLQETATPSNNFSVDLAANGTLTQPIADPTNELTSIIASVADDDQWWRVTFRGDRPENVTMRVWGNDIGDATDFQSEILFALQVVPDTGQHQIRLIKLTNASAVEDTTIVAYPKTDGSAVLTIDSVPANEVIRDVVFYQRGTTTAATGSFNRLQSNVITISKISEDTDFEIVTDTIVAPELRLVRSSFKMVPGAADVSPSSTTWAATNEYTKTINLTPNSKATISIPSVTGYSSGNATIGYVVGVLDSSDNLIAGGHRATVTNDTDLNAVADVEPWAVRMDTTVVSNARVGWPTVAIPEFTVPADGVVKFVFAPFGGFNVGDRGSGQTVMVETVNAVTIAAIDRIQTPRIVTLTGSIFHVDSPNRNSDTQATVYENLSNQVWVDVPAGQKIVSVATVPVNKATLGDLDLTNQRQAVNISTDSDIALTVTLGAVTGVHDITIFNFQTDNTIFGPSIANGDAVDNIGGWQFDARSDTRQARLKNVSGRRRFVKTASIWRGASSGGSVFPTTTYPNHTMGFEVDQARQLNPTNLDFTVGGGAAAGQVEYGIYEVFEFTDDTDRLEYNKIHEIWVSMAVGHAWVANDWRVKLVTWGN